MQKRSHKLLASALLQSRQGFDARRFEWAFLFGSFQPDCNPLTYLKGSWRAGTLCGHNFSNSQRFVNRKIQKLQERKARWTMWQYYTLGKLTHYLADAFTYPHNAHFPDGLMDHHRYETDLRAYLESYLEEQPLPAESANGSLTAAIAELHQEYLEAERSGMSQDVRYILAATGLLVAECCPAPSC